MEAFRSLLTRNLSAEALRSLALYITYACHKPRQRTLQLPQSMRRSKHNLDTVPRRATLLSSSPNTPVREGIASHQLTQLQTGTKILEMYAEMLCQRNDNTNIKKFARTVTNKAGRYRYRSMALLTVSSGSFISSRPTNQLWSF